MAVGLMGLVLGVMLQANPLFRQPDPDDPRMLVAASKRSEQPGKARVGHLLYQVVQARLQSVGTPEEKLTARITVRIADVQGTSDYIDNKTFHLLVDGEPLTHENNVNLTVYENAAVQAELIFVVPKGTTSAELLAGRAADGVARIALDLLPRHLADGS